MTSPHTYLIDMQGRVVHQWTSPCDRATSAYLLENGHLLRVGGLQVKDRPGGPTLGPGGLVQEFTWEGELVWDFRLMTDKRMLHHDALRLPNGNVLMIVWDKKTSAEALAAGCRPETVAGRPFLPDALLEVRPTGKTTGKIVWEWHLWDHLVQDYDPSRANYGDVAEHPELVDVNFRDDIFGPMLGTSDGMARLQSIGYLGARSSAKGAPHAQPDWTHFNSVDYHAGLDQILVSAHTFGEVWVIDHSTTTAEAAGHRGGRSGKGGDLLYRWGNPRAHRAGTRRDQRLFAQHSAHWIRRGLPGEGHVLVFNNGTGRPGGSYTSVDEIAWQVDSRGRYPDPAAPASGADLLVWSYRAPDKADFFAPGISGAHRLANGNTLICSGHDGTLFEVSPRSEILWKYVNPDQAAAGPMGFGMPPRQGGWPVMPRPPGEPAGFPILPPPLRDRLNLTAEQTRLFERLQRKVDTTLARELTDPQKKRLEEMQGGPAPAGPATFGGGPNPGQIMTPFQEARLKLTRRQKEIMRGLQNQVRSALKRILDARQQRQLEEAGDVSRLGGLAGPGPAEFGTFGGTAAGGVVFRAYRYDPQYPGLAGKDLRPGKTLEELVTAAR
jgi:hypothetical protein